MLTTERILVTSALPYANGPIHLGHLAGAYLPADIYVRYQRLKGRDVVFICGTDEHGVPISIAAEKEGITPAELVAKYHEDHNDVFSRVGISFDNFSGTARQIHVETSQEIFLDLNNKGYFHKKSIQQFYCDNCHRFLPDRFVEGKCPKCGADGARGDQCETCGRALEQTELHHPQCKVCGTTPVLRETYHLFFKLGKFQKALEQWLDGKKHWKENVLNYCAGWFNEGLDDRAVTRDIDWGIPVPLPGYEGKVIYVWFEAPIGYISSTKEWANRKGDPDLWKKYWLDKKTRLIHFIGKDNIVFHAIIWPAVLMGYGAYVLPDNIPANEFLNLEGAKLSTSRNYAVWLGDYLDRFPPDPLRYCLAADAPETKDADFSWLGFQTRNNSELADILGNFINRSLTFVKKNFNGRVPLRGELDELDRQMLTRVKNAPVAIGTLLEQFEIRKAITELMNIARFANKYFNDQQPWLTINQNTVKCATTINICLQTIKSLAILMTPFLPFSAQKTSRMLNITAEFSQNGWDSAGAADLVEGHLLGQPEILFRKIEDNEIEPEITRLKDISKKLKANAMIPEKKQSKPVKDPVSFEDFNKLDLRVAKILKAVRIPNTSKLLKLQIDIGPEERQIVAGIAQDYDVEKLIGRKIIVAVNLAPVKLRGEESRGMLLAAINEDGSAHLIAPDDESEIGALVA